ncbi:MFS transporter, partial [Bacillus cereus]|nr:MFS transporter [Bacillus cereus]
AVLAYVSTVVFNYWIVLVDTCFIFLAIDFLRPALPTFISKAAGKEQGNVAVKNSTYTRLGKIAGPAMVGILYDMNIHYT